MDRHRSAFTGRSEPKTVFAVMKGASAKGEQDRVSAMNRSDVFEIWKIVRPEDDIAHRAVGVTDVPVHQTCATFRAGQKRRGSPPPSNYFFTEIVDFLHSSEEIREHFYERVKAKRKLYFEKIVAFARGGKSAVLQFAFRRRSFRSYSNF